MATMRRSLQLTVAQLPNNNLAYSNKLYVHPNDLRALHPNNGNPFVQINEGVVYGLASHKQIEQGSIGFSRIQRNACKVSSASPISVAAFSIPETLNSSLIHLRFAVDIFRGTLTIEEDETVNYVLKELKDQVFCANQQFVYDYQGNPIKLTTSQLQVASTELKDQDIGKNVEFGVITKHTNISLTTSNARVKINHATSTTSRGVIGPDWKYSDMGIGGLDKEFGTIFRRAFASRTLPPKFVEQIGIEHVRGLLLYGPPGTGKTLIARQIGKMLNGREPKVVNGPEILNKYVGQSEENVRNLFVDAEEDQSVNGLESDLHIIIFDEIDAICKQRGSSSGGTGVHDTVVNQLLSKMDGVDSLNNILVIGMTNRKDMIDEALLRPGRFEVHIEIGLPDEPGRVQILKIHTRKMRENSVLDPDVDLMVLGERTKNFSGAEIAGLVRSAQAYSFYGKVDVHDMERVQIDDVTELKVGMAAFEYALDEVRPAYGVDKDDLKSYVGQDIIDYGEKFSHVYDTCKTLISQVHSSDQTPLLSVLLHGGVGSGKTALAAKLAIESGFFFTRIISPEELIGYTETARCSRIVKIFDDAYKSPLSLIILDNIERLLSYVAIGPRFSNPMLQTLLVLIKKKPPIDERTDTPRKLLILGTTSNQDILTEMDLENTFDIVLECPRISKSSEIEAVFKAVKANVSATDLKQICDGFSVSIGVKQLLMLIEMASQRGNGRITYEGFMRCADDLAIYNKL